MEVTRHGSPSSMISGRAQMASKAMTFCHVSDARECGCLTRTVSTLTLEGHLDKINWEIATMSLEMSSPDDLINVEIISPPSFFSRDHGVNRPFSMRPSET